MGGFRVVCGLVMGMAVCVWGGVYAAEPTIPLYLYNGNVGVGTETPEAMLDVSGNLKVRGPAYFKGFVGVGYDTDGIGKLSFHHSHTTPGNRYYTGWVYRNSSGSLNLESSDLNNLGIQFGGHAGYNTLSFQSVSWNAESAQKIATTRMVIKGDTGNVGVGTVTPTSKLTVNGDVYGKSFSTPYSFEWTARSEVFPNGSQTQKLYIDLGPIRYWGSLEVTIYDGWSYMRTTGKMTKLYDIGVNIGSPYPSQSRLTESFGHVATQWKLGEVEVGADNRIRIPIYHLASQQNAITVHIKGYATLITRGAEYDFALTIPESSTHALDVEHVSMALGSDQRIGVGTTMPTSKLQVIGTVNATALVGDGSGLTNVSGGWSSGVGVFYTERNVGIGTTNPLAKFVVASSNESLEFTVANTPYNGGVIEYINRNAGGVRPDLNYYLSTGGGSHKFFTSAIERLRITSAGNVGIGTATPEEIFTVRKSIPATVSQNYFVGINLRNLSDGGNRILFGNSITTTLAAIDGTVSSSGAGTDDGILVFNTSVNGAMTEKMRITNVGNLGIGTSAPTARLEVVGSAFINGGSLVNKNPNGPYYGPTIETDYPGGWAREYGFTRVGKTGKLFSLGVLGSGDSFNYGYIGGASSSETSHASPWMVFLPSGNVGVGTSSPGAKLHVAGNIVMGEGLASGAGIRIENRITSINASTMGLIAWGESGFGAAGDLVLAPRTSSSLFSVRVYTNGPDGIKERVRVAPNGNLGIGTAAPTQPLHVSGNALITSRMAINAAIDNAYALNVGGAIRATELVVNLNGWADYVFEPGYPLMPLSDVESFVKQNRHLPGMPSEAALKASGLNMAKVQTLQMQKIEELTLYVIELNKQNKALEARLEALEKGVAR